MTATGFTVDRRDLHFVLFEHLGIQDLKVPAYADYDQDVYEMVLAEAARLAEEVIAPVDGPGDRAGCRYEAGEVRTPPGYAQAWKAFRDGGWTGISIPQELGGQGLPKALSLSITECFAGASPAFLMYPGLTLAAANMLRNMGEGWMRDHVLPRLVSGEWAGTMCLTEPQAGSAVGDVSTLARRDGDSYLLTGQKIFVSGGEHDLTDNIVHIMLGRVEGAPSGIKGLSLFLVPKLHIDPSTGQVGERNDVRCAGIEHKMGINGSATCTLSLGEGGGARGFIIGEEGEGIARMFHMMNEARIGVAVQGLGVAAGAYANARAYAGERVQGTGFADFKNADARRVPILEHPDVRRMLLWMRAHVRGMRALTAQMAHWTELEEAGEHGLRDLVDVLVPIAKAWCTDRCFEVCRLAVQVYGGYGYIGEYPVEQRLRDSKIFSIYEGTNGIQALDLVGRKMNQKGGASFMATLNHLNEIVERLAAHGAFGAEADALGKARDRLGACAMHFMQQGMGGAPEMPVLHAVDMLDLFGDTFVCALLADHALRAADALTAAGASGLTGDALGDAADASDEGRYYAGKLDDLRFFAHQVLPRTAWMKAAITSDDRSALTARL